MGKKTKIIFLLFSQVFLAAIIYGYYWNKNITNNKLISQMSRVDFDGLIFQYPDIDIKNMKI